MRMATAMAVSATSLLVGACGGVQEEVAQQPDTATASSPRARLADHRPASSRHERARSEPKGR